MPPRRLPAPARPALVPPRPDDQLRAVAAILARGLHDPGALALRCEEVRRAADKPVPVLLQLAPHVPDCEVVPHDLGQYDRPRSAP